MRIIRTLAVASVCSIVGFGATVSNHQPVSEIAEKTMYELKEGTLAMKERLAQIKPSSENPREAYDVYNKWTKEFINEKLREYRKITGDRGMVGLKRFMDEYYGDGGLKWDLFGFVLRNNWVNN